MTATDTGTDDGADGGGQSIWTYQSVFATAPLVDAQNRYAAVGDTLTVQLSVEDVFGNTLPAPLSPTVELDVVFNDDLLGLGNWTGTEASYLVTGGEQAPNLGLNLTFDPGIILDSEGQQRSRDPENRDRALCAGRRPAWRGRRCRTPRRRHIWTPTTSSHPARWTRRSTAPRSSPGWKPM